MKMNLIQLVCHEGAVKILENLRKLFFGDEFAMNDIINHKEAHLGSKAIHFAAASGKREIIEMLIHDFGANIHDVTEHKLTVIHCAAQKHSGVFSIFLFCSVLKMSPRKRDVNKSTALHFAVLSGHIKNV
jgi:ankyrin repeat protein